MKSFMKKIISESRSILANKTAQRWVLNVTEHFEERFLERESTSRKNATYTDFVNNYLESDEEHKLALAIAFASKQASSDIHGAQKIHYIVRSGKTIVDKISIVLEKSGLNGITLVTWYRQEASAW